MLSGRQDERGLATITNVSQQSQDTGSAWVSSQVGTALSRRRSSCLATGIQPRTNNLGTSKRHEGPWVSPQKGLLVDLLFLGIFPLFHSKSHCWNKLPVLEPSCTGNPVPTSGVFLLQKKDLLRGQSCGLSPQHASNVEQKGAAVSPAAGRWGSGLQDGLCPSTERLCHHRPGPIPAFWCSASPTDKLS